MMRLLPQKTVPKVFFTTWKASFEGSAEQEGCSLAESIRPIEGSLIGRRKIWQTMHVLRRAKSVRQARPRRGPPSSGEPLTWCGRKQRHDLTTVDPADEECHDIALQQVELVPLTEVDGDGGIASPSHSLSHSALATEEV